MGVVLAFHSTASGHKSGRSSVRETPVSRSIAETNSAGTPRLDLLSQYQTCCCVVPMRLASPACPPAASQARSSADPDMGPTYEDFSEKQLKSLSGTKNKEFCKIPRMKDVDPKQLGARIAARRKERELSQEQLAALLEMSQQGIEKIENGHVKRPRLLREIALALWTSQDWLLFGEGEKEVVPDDEMSEQEVVEKYKKMSPEGRRQWSRAMRLASLQEKHHRLFS